MFDNSNPSDGSDRSRLVIEESDLTASEASDTEVLPPQQAGRIFARPEPQNGGQQSGGNPAPPVTLKKQPAAPPPIVAPSPKQRPQPEPTLAEAAAMGGGPGSPGAPGSEQGWFRNNSGKILAASGAVVALAVGFILVFVVLDVFSSDKQKVSDTLAASQTAFEGPVKAAHEAESKHEDRLPAIKQDAADAKDQAAVIRAKADALRADVKDGAIANPALNLLDAEERYLLEYGKVADLRESSLGDWREISPRMERAGQKIVAESQRVEALQLDSSATLVPPARDVEDAVSAINAIVVHAGKALKRWKARVAVAQQQRGGAVQYRDGMARLIDQYYDARDVTRAFTKESGTDYDTASSTLLQHARQRQGIIDQMNSLPVPPAAQSAHSDMVQLCTQSREILLTGAQDAQVDKLDPETPAEWPGSPGYERMLSSSDAITGQFDQRKQAVLGAANQAVQATRIPPKPRV